MLAKDDAHEGLNHSPSSAPAPPGSMCVRGRTAFSSSRLRRPSPAHAWLIWPCAASRGAAVHSAGCRKMCKRGSARLARSSAQGKAQRAPGAHQAPQNAGAPAPASAAQCSARNARQRSNLRLRRIVRSTVLQPEAEPIQGAHCGAIRARGFAHHMACIGKHIKLLARPGSRKVR